MKKKWCIIYFVLITSFSGISQFDSSTYKNVNFIGISDFDTLTFNFHQCMYDSVRKVNSSNFYVNFQLSEALLFKLKHGYMNPHHNHIYSLKTNDINTFATNLLSDIEQNEIWVLGNDKILNETDFIFFNSVYPNLFTKDFIEGVKQWRYDKTKFIKLSYQDSNRMFNYLDEKVTDSWDKFVLKNAICRVSKSSKDANIYRTNLLEDKITFPSYSFLTGYDYLHAKNDTLKIDIILNTPYSPAFFDGYSFQKKKKNRHYLKELSHGFHKIESQSIGIYDLKKFKKVNPNGKTYIFNFAPLLPR